MEDSKEDARAKAYFTTHLALEEFLKGIKDIPKNKKLRSTVYQLFIIFRYKWQLAKSESGVKFWSEEIRKAISELTD